MQVVNVNADVIHQGKRIPAGHPFEVTQEEARRYLALKMTIQPVDVYDKQFLAEMQARPVTAEMTKVVRVEDSLDAQFELARGGAVSLAEAPLVLDDATDPKTENKPKSK